MKESVPLDEDRGGIGIVPDTICGYCTQGRHSECRGYDCACADGHPQ